MDRTHVGIMNETNPKPENIIPKILPFSAVVYLANLGRLQASQRQLVLDLKLSLKPFPEHLEPYENAGQGHFRVVDSPYLVRTRFANDGAMCCSIGGEERVAGQDGWS